MFLYLKRETQLWDYCSLVRVVGYVNCYTKCGQWLSLNILYSFIKQIFITCLPRDRHDSRPCGHEQTTQVQILPSCSSQYIEWFVFYRSLWPLSEELTIQVGWRWAWMEAGSKAGQQDIGSGWVVGGLAMGQTDCSLTDWLDMKVSRRKESRMI